jgi:hypothetical protein
MAVAKLKLSWYMPRRNEKNHERPVRTAGVLREKEEHWAPPGYKSEAFPIKITFPIHSSKMQTHNMNLENLKHENLMSLN